MPKIHLTITPKPALLDAQGRTVQHALHALGFDRVEDVRIGKILILDVPGEATEDELTLLGRQMCETLLANPVTESYRVEVKE